MTDFVPAPSKTLAIKTWLTNNLAVVALGAMFAFYVYHEQSTKVEVPVSAFAAEAKAYKDSLGPRFADTAGKIRSSELNNKKDVIDYLSKNADPMAQAIDALIDANVDHANGNITNRPNLIEGFNKAAVNLGAKAK
jgi:hypothetical protein